MKSRKPSIKKSTFLGMSLLALSLALAPACATSVDDDLTEEEMEEIQEDLDVIYATPEQLDIYDACMETMEDAGATYRSAHRHCKRRALSEA